MYRTQDQVIDLLKKYVAFVNKVFYVKEVYLFGSYSKNQAHEWSDIDLAIISPDFKEIPRPLAMKILSKMAFDFDTSIEAIPFAHDDFSQAKVGSLAYEIRQTGKQILF